MSATGSTILFSETLEYKNKGVLLKILVAISALLLFFYFDSNGKYFVVELVVVVALLAELAMLLLFKTKLEITAKGISVSAAPFNKQQQIAWSEVKSASAVSFKFPFLLPGMGFGNNPLFNTGCSTGIVLYLHNGSHLRIGVKSIAEADAVLSKIFSGKIR